MSSMKNPFTAPDAVDILREKRMSLRHAILLLCSGVFLVGTLLCGYRLGTWLLERVTVPVQDLVPLVQEDVAPAHTTDSRLEELSGGATLEVDTEAVSRRVDELNASTSLSAAEEGTQAQMQERKSELDR
ncbi:MAG: hypothetical protein RLZZ234_374 [Candidatus Parcubacteria bacterium]|jgi:hypothetical protein